jgi:hypothetical protein
MGEGFSGGKLGGHIDREYMRAGMTQTGTYRHTRHIHSHSHRHPYTHIHNHRHHTHTQPRTPININIHIHPYTHRDTHTHIHTHTYTHNTHIHIHTHAQRHPYRHRRAGAPLTCPLWLRSKDLRALPTDPNFRMMWFATRRSASNNTVVRNSLTASCTTRGARGF